MNKYLLILFASCLTICTQAQLGQVANYKAMFKSPKIETVENLTFSTTSLPALNFAYVDGTSLVNVSRERMGDFIEMTDYNRDKSSILKIQPEIETIIDNYKLYLNKIKEKIRADSIIVKTKRRDLILLQNEWNAKRTFFLETKNELLVKHFDSSSKALNESFFDLVELANSIYRNQIESIKNEITALETHRITLSTDVNQLKTQLGSLNASIKRVAALDNIKETDKLKFDSTLAKLVTQLENFNKKTEEIKASIVKKEESKKPDVGTQPNLNITSILGKQRVVPNFNLLAAQTFEFNKASNRTKNQTGIIQLNIFSGGSENDFDSTNINNLFIQEASRFGVCLDFNYTWQLGEENTNRLPVSFGLNLNFSYLNKNLKIDTTLNHLGLLHGRAGFQMIFFNNRLSFFYNENFLTVSENVKIYETKFNNEARVKKFTEMGFNISAPLAQDNSFLIDLRVGFLLNSRTLKDINGSVDLFVPKFKIGFRKDVSL